MMKEDEVKKEMIRVEVRQRGDKSVVNVEAGDVKKTDVNLDDLGDLFKELRQGRPIVAIDHDDDVPHGVIVKVQSEAKKAGIDKIILIVPG